MQRQINPCTIVVIQWKFKFVDDYNWPPSGIDAKKQHKELYENFGKTLNANTRNCYKSIENIFDCALQISNYVFCDFQDIKMIDERTMVTFVEMMDKFFIEDKKLAFFNIDQKVVLPLMDMLGMSSILPIFKNLRSCLSHFSLNAKFIQIEYITSTYEYVDW